MVQIVAVFHDSEVINLLFALMILILGQGISSVE